MKKTPIGAHVILHKLLPTNKEKKNWSQAILLYKRTQDAPIHPGNWSLLGGKLESGESPEIGAQRELQEELSIDPIKSLNPLCDVSVRQKNAIVLIRYFSAILDIDCDKLTLKRNLKEGRVEGDGIGWFTAEELHHLRVRPEDRKAISIFFLKKGT